MLQWGWIVCHARPRAQLTNNVSTTKPRRASAFQLAGFPHVIGTLWEIDDATAVEIARAFYTALADRGGSLVPRHAARALHQATRTQRDQQPANPYLWATHIHVGA
jgi:CHAT domain-containing protein